VSGARILVVDDHALNQKLLRVTLTRAGYDVATAGDAAEAQRAIAELRPRLVLMDVQLPGIDGLEMTRRLKADPATRDLVVIAVTAHAMAGDAERALAAGCDAYIAKPIDPAAVLALVARHLGHGA